MSKWIWWMIAGCLSLIGGIIAFANPMAATLTAVALAGYTFIFVGVATVISAFADQSWGQRILAILLGALMLFLGVNLLGEPLQGMLSLTVAVAIGLIFAGILRLVIGFGSQGNVRWLMILSGAISLLLAFMIFSDFPASATVVLGVFLAVELVSNGISLIVLALARKTATV